MDALISQVKHEAISVDEAGRQKILDGLRDLAMSIETPEDSMQRIMFLVCLLFHSAPTASAFLKSNSWFLAPSNCRRPCRDRYKAFQPFV